jgi:hypothetical protein
MKIRDKITSNWLATVAFSAAPEDEAEMGSMRKQVAVVGKQRQEDADLPTLCAFSNRSAYWTGEIALLAGNESVDETYRALDRLEQRHMVRRIVRIGQTSWRRTELGTLVANMVAVVGPR